MSSDITIRPLTTHAELRACEDVQRQAWNMHDLEIVPMHMLVAFNLHGGLVLGAYDRGEQVGFLCGYPGHPVVSSRRVEPVPPPAKDGEPTEKRALVASLPVFHSSQMLGVIPAYQNRGVGYALKCEQRRILLAEGHTLALWTFDPLLSRNAHFNITRLGALSRRYIVNLYDELPGLNGGLDTDRLEVEWWLDTPRVVRALDGAQPPRYPTLHMWRMAGAEVANETARRADGFLVPPDGHEPLKADRLLVEIPADFDAIKAADMDLAREWRRHIRAVFQHAFDEDYVVAWFATEGAGAERRSFYVLQKGFDPKILGLEEKK